MKTGLATVQSHSPVTSSASASSKDPLFSTRHLYLPSSRPVTVSVLVLAVIVVLITIGEMPSDNTFPSPSRVQMTVVAGPVKTQVRVNIGGSAVGVVWRLNWSGLVMAGAPEGGVEKSVKYLWVN